MTEINIVIYYEDTLSRIYTETGYTSQARSNIGLSPELSDTMAATEDDSRILRNFFIGGVNEAATFMTRYMMPCTTTIVTNSKTKEIEEGIIDTTVPANYPSQAVIILEREVKEFITNYMMYRWMMTVKPDEAEITAVKLQNSTNRIREILATRKKPL